LLGHVIIPVPGVHGCPLSNLLEIRLANRPLSRLFRAFQSRQQQTGQNRDYRDNHQQFYQREKIIPVFHFLNLKITEFN
jgi:hypothetical protein